MCERLVFKLIGEAGYIDGSSFTDEDLSNIPDDTRFLSLENAQVTDEGIKNIANLKDLVCLDLDFTKVSDESMKIIGGISSLVELWIEDTVITDKGIEYLHNLSGLKFISILDTSITDEAVSKLVKKIPDVEVHL